MSSIATATITLCSLLCVCVGESRIHAQITPCRRSDPAINLCLATAANTVSRLLRQGIPLGVSTGSVPVEVSPMEPIIIDEISIALGSGPDGYRAAFRDIHVYGIQNLTVVAVRSHVDSLQFQLSLFVPRIRTRAHYVSSGVLLMVRASGGGDYWGDYDGVRAKVYLRARPRDDTLAVDDLKMDFSVRDITMGIHNLHNGNAVMEAALNLFINSHGQELLKQMKPALRSKLVSLLRTFLDSLFARLPFDAWLGD